MAEQPRSAADVISLVEEHDVRFIRLWFTDVLGQLKSFSVNASELEDAFEGGMGFDGSSITGFNPIEESDMLAVPDPATFELLPDTRAPIELRAYLKRGSETLTETWSYLWTP